MLEDDLRNLWKLHLVDSAIVDIRKRHAGLDPGREIMAAMDVLKKEFEEKNGLYKALHAEQTDLELQQKTLEAKSKKINAELYGGKIVNPREVENFQKELAIFKKQSGDIDLRILELWDLIPPAKADSDDLASKIALKERELAEFRAKSADNRTFLESEFKAKSALRPGLAAKVSKELLTKYDSIRQKHGGIGMAEVMANQSCGACGTKLPDRSVLMAVEKKMISCEACHRMLYKAEAGL